MPKRNRTNKRGINTETEKFKLKDILYGLVIPVVVAFIILAFPIWIGPAATSAFGSDSPIPQILTHGFALMVVFAIPILVGLIWNKWAGGAAGFLMGTLYYIAYGGYNIMSSRILYQYDVNLWADPAFIGNYILGGILIGYIAGALNNKSWSFKRMFGAGMTAALTVGFMTFILNYTVSSASYMTRNDPIYAFWTTMLPLVILGVIAPVIAKVMTWYGLYPGGHS